MDYQSVIISYSNKRLDMDKFKKECSYINGESKNKIDQIMSDNQRRGNMCYGLIIECNLVKTKKGKDMVIGTLYNGVKNRTFGTVKTVYSSKIPIYATAGDYVKFTSPTHDFFINNMEVIDL